MLREGNNHPPPSPLFRGCKTVWRIFMLFRSTDLPMLCAACVVTHVMSSLNSMQNQKKTNDPGRRGNHTFTITAVPGTCLARPRYESTLRGENKSIMTSNLRMRGWWSRRRVGPRRLWLVRYSDFRTPGIRSCCSTPLPARHDLIAASML